MARPVALQAGVDPYNVLNVLPTASLDEIRISFKRLVLESHPDKNPARREWSERRIRQLIEAFDLLSNSESRAAFDRRRRASSRGFSPGPSASAGTSRPSEKVEPFFFRKKDPESRALLVLHLLLNNRARAAVRVLQEMEAQLGKTFLYDQLTREDYLDCLFLLGEFHIAQRNFAEAVRRLEAFYSYERKSRFPRHYIDQVVRRLKDLYLRKLPRHADPETALRGLREAQALKLTRAEESLALRRMAELLVRLGRVHEAERVLDRARRLFPEGKLVEEIQETIRGGVHG